MTFILLKNSSIVQKKIVFYTKLRTCLLFLFMLLNSFVAHGDQIFLSSQALIKTSDVAVTGKLILKQNITLTNKQVIRVGAIYIEQVFKGLPTSQQSILIELPPFTANGMLKSTDVVLEIGNEGLWLLKKHTNGLYRIERPDALLPKEKATILFK
ncbi:hypothetical protein H4J57_08760 [Colwellia sp. BRX8-7]|uniref:hypothetical protein n=1 Tax=Colwellia sp. BRX8-7 TaxID=2759833 RepID=UPI0015F47F30|nr:hypothetical protein [Colwellia sp. BRX8-7]MBA6337289.1 hypothetical protein [Colwellia sp. BRX8-7]